VQVKWTLFDEWYRTVTTYEATVPVEPYDDLWRFGVHFFPDARVRVVSTRNGGPGKLAPEIKMVQWMDNSNPYDYYPFKDVAQGKVLSAIAADATERKAMPEARLQALDAFKKSLEADKNQATLFLTVDNYQPVFSLYASGFEEGAGYCRKENRH
jgi:nucleoid-associated protein YgaU